jgi:hypothetical protein
MGECIDLSPADDGVDGSKDSNELPGTVNSVAALFGVDGILAGTDSKTSALFGVVTVEEAYRENEPRRGSGELVRIAAFCGD